jgi:hypothetical protein
LIQQFKALAKEIHMVPWSAQPDTDAALYPDTTSPAPQEATTQKAAVVLGIDFAQWLYLMLLVLDASTKFGQDR